MDKPDSENLELLKEFPHYRDAAELAQTMAEGYHKPTEIRRRNDGWFGVFVARDVKRLFVTNDDDADGSEAAAYLAVYYPRREVVHEESLESSPDIVPPG